MRNEVVKVWHEGRELELPRERCWMFDRSRHLTGQTCPRKRWLQYGWQGRGLDTAWRSEDLALGSAVHAGLEWLLLEAQDYRINDGNDAEAFAQAAFEHAADKAHKAMMDAAAGGLQMQDDDAFASQLPEVARVLAEEQAHLAYALVWTFGRRHLAGLLERFEVVAVEPEVNWLVGWVGAGAYPEVASELEESGQIMVDQLMTHTQARAIVMMSRPDAVLRSREDGRLWTVSWKTTKRFTGESLEKLECDLQGLTEGLAVRARWGEEPGGTFYTYFVKGDKRWSDEDGAKRYVSHLVRPYMAWSGVGEVGPGNFRCTYTRQRGWQRVNAWEQMSMAEWLGLLDGGEVEPDAGLDWLAEAVAEPAAMPFQVRLAEEWRASACLSEAEWASVQVDERVAKHTGSCFTWGKRCTWFDVCWRGRTIEEEVAMGRKVVRVPNHAAEIGGEE